MNRRKKLSHFESGENGNRYRSKRKKSSLLIGDVYIRLHAMISFDEAIASVGLSRYETSYLRPKTIAGVLREARDYALKSLSNISSSHGALPPIHFDLVDDPALNAGAFRYKGEYFIFINTGAIGLLALFFIRVLADRRFFPEIGRPEVERETLPSFGTLAANALKMKNAFKWIEAPIDQARIDFSYGLIIRAVSFLFAHELTHVFDGHLDFLAQRGSSFYAEFNKEPSFDFTERQALELDADHGAACAEIGQLLRKVADDPKDDPSLFNSHLLNPRYALFIWFFAVHTLFRFFGDARFTPPDLACMPYPPPRLRQWWLAQTTQRQITTCSKRPDLAPTCRTISNSALLLVEEAFSALTDGIMAVQGIEDAEMHGNWYASEQYRYWKNILRPKLGAFALMPLPE